MVLKTPHHNGVAESMNLTLNERDESMRLQTSLPKMFWTYLINKKTYLINIGPSFPIGFKILEDEWKGWEISLKHLKIFGCV